MRQGGIRSKRFRIVAGAFATLLAFSVAAHAQNGEPTPSDIKQAAKAFDIAREAYGAEDYDTAADQFEKADGHAPSAVALQWAIESHHQAGHAARAATLAALAKQRHPDVAELIELADRVISETEAQLIEVQVVCDEPCELLVDNKIVHGRYATTRTLFLEPGPHTVVGAFGDKRMSQTEEINGEADDVVSVILTPPPLGALGGSEEGSLEGMSDPFAEDDEDDVVADQPKPEAPSGWSPAIFWVGASLTAVSGVVTTWSGLDTQKNPGPGVVRERCEGKGTSCEEYQEGLRKQRRTNILLGVTGGLAVFTIVAAVVTDWSDLPPPSQEVVRKPGPRQTGWSIEPWLTVGHGAALGASGRF